MATRDEMIVVLKARCVAYLRTKGFKGSFPNLYRNTGRLVALVNFQFFSSGGSFCVNLSYAGPKKENVYFKPDTPPKKLSVSQTTDQVRLGAEKGDRWFSFGATSYGQHRGIPQAPAAIANMVNDRFESQAEPWWESKRRQYEDPENYSPATETSVTSQKPRGFRGCKGTRGVCASCVDGSSKAQLRAAF